MPKRLRSRQAFVHGAYGFFPALPFALATVVLLASCTSDGLVTSDVTPSDALVSIDAGPVAAKAGLASAVYTFPPETATLVPGAGAELIRTKNGVNYRFTTNSLHSGHAYTLWIVIFNEPENCVDGCDGNDLFTEAAKPDMLYGTGLVVGGSGMATFAGRARVGDASESVQEPLGLAPNGLIDPFGAEVHLVVHHHGEKLPEFMPDMIQSLAGGCTDSGIPEAGGASPWNAFATGPNYGQEFGRLGPNACASVQFAVMLP